MIIEAGETTATEASAPSPRATTRRIPAWLTTLVWWMVPITGILLVLTSSYAAITHQRYARANGVTGELLPGHSVAQSFVSRYSNLSGVELWIGTYVHGERASPATLVVRLQSEPPDGPDLATVQLPAGRRLGENPWHLFSFPPITDSENKAYRVIIESPDAAPGAALTLFRWHDTAGDPYVAGTSFSDHEAVRGDLAFGLHYSPSPLAAWLQLARATSANFPPFLMLLVLGAALASMVWATVRLPVLLREAYSHRRWLIRRSLPIALSVAFVHSLIYVMAIPPWQGPDEYSHFAYAALLDKYDLDDTRVQQVIDEGQTHEQRLIEAVNASMYRHNYTRLLPSFIPPGGKVETRDHILQEVRQPAMYYWLCAAAMRAARAVGVQVDPYASPEGALTIMRMISLLLRMGVVALAWLAACLLCAGRTSWMRLLLPLAVALMPMHTFASSMANNGVLAEVAASALFVVLIALLRYPTGVRGIALASTLVLLALASFLTKSTATAVAIPMLALGLPVWLGVFAARMSSRRSLRAAVLPASLLVLTLACATIGLAGFERQDTVPGWRVGYWPTERAPRVQTSSSHEGSYVIELGPHGKFMHASQVLVPNLPHPGLTVTCSGWARLAPGQESGDATGHSALAPGPHHRAPAPAKARIQVRIKSRDVQVGEAVLDPDGTWSPITVTAHIAESAWPVSLWLVADAGDRAVQFDDLKAEVGDLSWAWDDPIFRPKLLNPSAETGAISLRGGLADALPSEWVQMVDVVANPQTLDKWALWSEYADVQHRSFWGNFGWLSLPLPPVAYILLDLMVVLSLVGLAWLALKRLGRWGALEWLGFISALSFVIAVLIGFARQTAVTATTHTLAHPQGRFLFVLIVPIIWLLLAGLREVWSWLVARADRRRHRTRVRQVDIASVQRDPSPSGAPSGLAWGVWLFCNAIFVFATYCILSLVLPYFYA